MSLTSPNQVCYNSPMQTITTLSEATPVQIDTKLSDLQQIEAQARVKYDRINASLTQAEVDEINGKYSYTPYTTDDLDEAYNNLADAIPSKRLHGIILRTCWDWMPGGDTATTTADKIMDALDKKGMLR